MRRTGRDHAEELRGEGGSCGGVVEVEVDVDVRLWRRRSGCGCGGLGFWSLVSPSPYSRQYIYIYPNIRYQTPNKTAAQMGSCESSRRGEMKRRGTERRRGICNYPSINNLII